MVSGTLALLGLWQPALASVLLVLGLLGFAAAMDLTAVDQDLGVAEGRIEGSAPVHEAASDEP